MYCNHRIHGMENLSIVIPILDESHEILQNLVDELTSLGAEIIVVDDGSKIPFPGSIKHDLNMGYGEAIITGLKSSNRELVMTIDGDGQHTVSEVVKLYHAYLLIQDACMVVGVRRLKGEKFIRFLGRKFLNWTASIICTYWIPDLNSGCRIFRREIALSYVSILCRTFSFTTSLTVSMMADGRRVEYFPINVEDRQFGKSKVKVIKHGFITLYYILRNGLALRTRKLRAWLRKYDWWMRLTGK